MHHLVIAIPLSLPVKESLSKLCFGLSNATWHPAEDLYLFLFDLKAPDLGAVKTIAYTLQRTEIKDVTQFPVSFKGVELFKHNHAPSYLAITLSPAPQLKKLKTLLAAELHEQRIPVEQKPYFPHITLGHLSPGNETKVSQYLMENLTLPHIELQATSFALIDQKHSSMEILQEFPFSAEN
jgi:2'-5' RNA ligase